VSDAFSRQTRRIQVPTWRDAATASFVTLPFNPPARWLIYTVICWLMEHQVCGMYIPALVRSPETRVSPREHESFLGAFLTGTPYPSSFFPSLSPTLAFAPPSLMMRVQGWSSLCSSAGQSEATFGRMCNAATLRESLPPGSHEKMQLPSLALGGWWAARSVCRQPIAPLYI